MLTAITSMRRAARCALQCRGVIAIPAPVTATCNNTQLQRVGSTRSQQLSLPHQSIAARSFASASSSSADSNGTVIDAADENRFLEIADTALHDIMSWLDGVEEMLEESDVSLAQGVLKIDLGESGTWVINRQIPNRQIWWSSPISGPRRYELDAATGTWRNTRDGTELMELLRNEIFEATGIEIYE